MAEIYYHPLSGIQNSSAFFSPRFLVGSGRSYDADAGRENGRWDSLQGADIDRYNGSDSLRVGGITGAVNWDLGSGAYTNTNLISLGTGFYGINLTTTRESLLNFEGLEGAVSRASFNLTGNG